MVSRRLSSSSIIRIVCTATRRSLSRSGMPPNFFIVGAPKAGSTSLYHYLDQHPQIYMCPVKEPCHFAPEVRPENLSPEYRSGAMFDSRATKAYLRGPKLERR